MKAAKKLAKDNFENLPEDDGTYEEIKKEKAESVSAAMEEMVSKARHASALFGQENAGGLAAKPNGEADNDSNPDKAGTGQDKALNAANQEVHDMMIVVNNTPVKLSGKSSYVLVDLFQFYKFDLNSPQKGGNIVLKLNGIAGEYMASIKDGDIVELYWE